MSNLCQSRVNGPGSVTTRKSDPEFVALADCFVRLIKDEIRCVDDKVLCPNYPAAHTRVKSDRAVRLATFFEIALMIFLRAPELWVGLNLRNDGPFEFPAFCQLLLRCFSRSFLLRRMVEDDCAILRPHIRPLSV